MKYVSLGNIIVVGLIMILSTENAYSQEVEHNYKVGPQATTCDSLMISDVSPEAAVKIIKSKKYRFQQSFKLTRRQGFKGGEFYSCNGENGFLILLYNEKELLFTDVQKTIWENLISSTDPEGYFLNVRPELKQFN